MRQALYIQQFEKMCPSLKYILDEKPSSAMGLWILLKIEFWETLGKAPRKTKQIIDFCRYSVSPDAHPALRQGVDYAFGEHLLDEPDMFPELARYITKEDLDAFEESLIRWNGQQKYSRRRNRLEGLMEARSGEKVKPEAGSRSSS